MRRRWIDESTLAIKGDRARRMVETIDITNSEPLGDSKATAKLAFPKFDSKLEAAYFQYLEALRFAGEIDQFWYHPGSMSLPGGLRYAPDFLVQVPRLSRPLEIHETKGWSRNLRDGMTRFHIARGIYTCYGFKLVRRIKGQWDVRAV